MSAMVIRACQPRTLYDYAECKIYIVHSEFGNEADGVDKFSHFSGVNWKGLI